MRKFDLSIGASDGYIQSAYKKSGSIGSDLVEKIIDTYTDLNPYWLITGKGEMILSNGVQPNISESGKEYSYDPFELTLLKYLDNPRIQEKIKSIIHGKEEEKGN